MSLLAFNLQAFDLFNHVRSNIARDRAVGTFLVNVYPSDFASVYAAVFREEAEDIAFGDLVFLAPSDVDGDE